MNKKSKADHSEAATGPELSAIASHIAATAKPVAANTAKKAKTAQAAAAAILGPKRSTTRISDQAMTANRMSFSMTANAGAR